MLLPNGKLCICVSAGIVCPQDLWTAWPLSHSLPFSWKIGLNSYSCKCRNQVPPPHCHKTCPSPPPCLFIHARNVNSYRALSLCPATFVPQLFSQIQTPHPFPNPHHQIDMWVVGVSRPCCPGISPVIGSAGWLMVDTADGRHFPQTDTTSRSTLPFPCMDHIASLLALIYLSSFPNLTKDLPWLCPIQGQLLSSHMTQGKMYSQLMWWTV